MIEGSKHFRSSFPDPESTSFRTSAWDSGVARSASELRPYQPTLLHALATAARQDATTGITYIDERDQETHRSYRELYHRAVAAAEMLLASGLQRGDRVLLALPTCFEFGVAYFAVQMAGGVPVPCYPPSGFRLEAGVEKISQIADSAGARLCLTNSTIRPLLGKLAANALRLEDIRLVENFPDSAEKRKLKPQAVGTDPAFIQYTSGSTGKPKGVLLAHENLMANIHSAGQALRINRRDVLVSWVPLYHDMGLIGGFLFSIYWRIPLVLMPPTSFLAKPSRWLWAIHRHKGTISPAPNFAYALCVRRVKPQEREGLDLSSWRLALNGAESVDYRTIVSFTETYAAHGFRPETMLPVYGLAESSLAVTIPELGSPPKHLLLDRARAADGHAVRAIGKGAMAVVSVGRPVPGHDVIVVDEEGRPQPEYEVGHVVVRGPSLMQGYFENPTATARVVRDGWLWTGDLGFFAEGELYINGRVKDMIILRGHNYYAEDLERVAERVAGVRPGGSIAFGVHDEEQGRELAVLVVETREEEATARADLVKRVSATVLNVCDLCLDEVVLVAPYTLPKTSSGKKQRSLCRQLYLQGQLRAPSQGKAKLALIYARSQAGYLVAAARKILGWRRSEPA